MSDIEWKFFPAQDCTVDPEYRLFLDGLDTGFHISDGRQIGGGYALGHWNEQSGTLQLFEEYRSLKKAKEAILVRALHS